MRRSDRARQLLVALLVLAGGCSSLPRLTPAPKVIKLAAKHAPLVQVREAHDLPGLKPGMVSTAGTECVTLDMGALLDAYPEGSVEWDVLFAHEREHALQQAEDPLYTYRYQTDPTGYRWAAEKRGWRVELRALRAAGRKPVFDSWARALADNYGGMCTFTQAREWLVAEWSTP